MGERIKTIVFFDETASVDRYVAGGRKGLDGDICIAMKPAAYSYLLKNGIKACDTRGYFTNESHKRSLKESDRIIELLRGLFRAPDDGPGMKEIWNAMFIFKARMVVTYCLWTIEIVLNAIEKHAPERLEAALSRRMAVAGPLVMPEERYTGQIVKTIAEYADLPFVAIDGAQDAAFSESRFKSSVLNSVKYIAAYLRFRFWEKKTLIAKFITGKKPIFFTTGTYQMDKYARDILHEFPDEKMYFFGDPVMPYYNIPVFAKVITHPKHRKALAAWEDALERFIESIRAERTALSYRGISFADVLAGKIYYAIGNFMVNSFLWEKELDNSLDRLGPAVIVTNGTRPDDTILAALGSRKNIRTVLISHGSHVGPKDEYERIEWGEHGKMLLRAPFSALALQTPLAEDYLNAFPSKSETVRTGALLWGRPVNTARSEELFARMFAGSYKRRDVNVVLYAGTSKGSYALRFHVYETSDEYIQSIRDMIEAVKDMPETVLIVKFRPSPEISLEDLKSLIDFSGRVVLSVEEPFSDLLGMADLLVSFSSTTIEEALQNEIPVLLYGGNGRYRHIPAYEVSVGGAVKAAAVYHAEDPGSLRYAIDNIVALKKRREIDKTLFSPYMYDKSDRAGPARLLGVG